MMSTWPYYTYSKNEDVYSFISRSNVHCPDGPPVIGTIKEIALNIFNKFSKREPSIALMYGHDVVIYGPLRVDFIFRTNEIKIMTICLWPIPDQEFMDVLHFEITQHIT